MSQLMSKLIGNACFTMIRTYIKYNSYKYIFHRN